MTTFLNQTIGSHDDGSYEYVSVWFDETIVEGFQFHSIITRDGMGNTHMVYGMEVDARHVWSAIRAFSTSPTMAVAVDKKYSRTFGCTEVWLADGVTREFRMGDKWGKPIARMVKTGYVQQERKA